jgi:hypothetical protein
MFNIVASPGATDSRICADGLFVLYEGRKEPFSYFSKLGPPLVSALRSIASPAGIWAPFIAEPAALQALSTFRLVHPRKFWITRPDNDILIACRAASPSGDFEDLPRPMHPWEPPLKTLASFAVPYTCPLCANSSLQFRLYEKALICSACGRSHRAAVGALALATLEKVPL